MSATTLSFLFNGIGLTGAALFLVAYYLVQRGTLTDHDPRYLWMNLWGALAIIASLCWAWNLPAFVMEVIWASISVYGLINARRRQA